MTLVSTVLAGSVGTVAYEAISPWVSQKVQEYAEMSDDKLAERQKRLRLLVPFVDHADVFIGQRRPWVEDKLTEVGDYLESLTAKETGSMFDVDNIGKFSANELLQTLDFLIATNVAMHKDGPTDVFLNGDLEVDFSGDLIAIGGPIPNYYTRNLMYGDEIDLPYRFDLNPDDGSDDTSQIPPKELRAIGLNDDRGFEQRPGWRLVTRDGDPPIINNRRTTPKKQNGDWVLDYFTIIKVPNVHPAAEPAYGEEPTSLVLAGCHGIGTRAAIKAIQTEQVLDVLETEAGDGHFQALGRVGNVGDNSIDPDEIVIPPDHVQPLDVE